MNTVIDAMTNVSVVTKIELLSLNAPKQQCKTLSRFINDATVLILTNNGV